MRILFVQRDAGDVERYLQELRILGFKVSSDVAISPEQFTTRLLSEAYDLVVAEYPFPDRNGTPVLELLHQTGKHIPLIFISDAPERQTLAELISRRAYDCIDLDHLDHFPVAIRRALNEADLRAECDRAQKMLKYSEANIAPWSATSPTECVAATAMANFWM